MWYYTSGNTQIRVAFTAAMMKLKGAKIPPKIVFPIQLQNQRVRDSLRQGLSAGSLGDVADPAVPAARRCIRPRDRRHMSISRGKAGSPREPLPRPCTCAAACRSGAKPRDDLLGASSLRGVSKSFGAVQALREVSFDCRPGEMHALVGENGSGKSTLLGIASGFVAPDRGEIEIGGQLRRRGSPAEARTLGLGMAYQTYSHVLDLSVAENLYLAAPREPAAAVRTDGGVGLGRSSRSSGSRSRWGRRRGRSRSQTGSSSR